MAKTYSTTFTCIRQNAVMGMCNGAYDTKLSLPSVKSSTGQKTRHAQHAYAAIPLGNFIGKLPSSLYYQITGGTLTPTGVITSETPSSVKSSTGQKTRHAQHAYAAIPLGSFDGKGVASGVYYQVTGGTLTPVGVNTEQLITTAQVGGTLTPVGSTLKRAAKLFSGSITPTGAVIKQTQKDGLAGALSPGGAVTKETQKPLAGEVTPAGDGTPVLLIKQAAAGSLTPQSSLAAYFILAAVGLFERSRRFISFVTNLGRSEGRR